MTVIKKKKSILVRVLKFRAVNRDIFDAIKAGKKKVETRAATERYRDIRAGDAVVLSCGKMRIEKKVRRADFLRLFRLC